MEAISVARSFSGVTDEQWEIAGKAAWKLGFEGNRSMAIRWVIDNLFAPIARDDAPEPSLTSAAKAGRTLIERRSKATADRLSNGGKGG
jgi:hypothetical protein